MRLRPHHLLCIQKYTGHGYDAAFTAHMDSLVAELNGRPDTPITVTEGCDELCTECPHRKGGACVSLEKVTTMDNGVFDVCELTYGACAPWGELAKKARERVLKTDTFARICEACQWYELCQNTEVIDA